MRLEALALRSAEEALKAFEGRVKARAAAEARDKPALNGDSEE